MKHLIFAIIMLTWVSSNVYGQDGKFELGTFRLNKEYNISMDGVINLSCSDAKVFITGSNRNSAHIKVYRKVVTKGIVFDGDSEEFGLDVVESQGSLKIQEKPNTGHVGIFMGSTHTEYKIEIEAPEGVSLTVKGDDGDYYIKNINGAISLELDDADAQLTDCKGDKFSFRMDDGDVTMDKGKGSLEVIGDDADVRIYNAQFTSIEANVDDGDLVIETSLDDNGKYRLESEDGLIAINITGGGGEFDIRLDDGRVVTEGNFKTLEERENKTRLLLADGSAKVNVRADDARVKLTTR